MKEKASAPGSERYGRTNRSLGSRHSFCYAQGNAKHPSGLLVRMLEGAPCARGSLSPLAGLEENGKMPPAPGWRGALANDVKSFASRLMQSQPAGVRREPADAKDRKKSRSRSKGR